MLTTRPGFPRCGLCAAVLVGYVAVWSYSNSIVAVGALRKPLGIWILVSAMGWPGFNFQLRKIDY
ncbi:hypothetical protein K440DRAFT_613375 [Wilcoxina mikolae CBS 423.85]|nr:hypothetical protein K440DRAFT_613375 [Wilcoxina mikolae CBS 423.85]